VGTSLAALRAQFPVLERVAYLNAGTNGPVPAAAVAAARAELEREQRDGRAREREAGAEEGAARLKRRCVREEAHVVSPLSE